MRAAKSHRRYDEFARLYDEYDKLGERDDVLQTRWAKCQRLLRTLERVALAHNIGQVADEETMTRYKALVAAEDGTLGPAKR